MKKIEIIDGFDDNYKKYIKNRDFMKEKKSILDNIDYLKNFNKIEINNIIDFLLKHDYVMDWLNSL